MVKKKTKEEEELEKKKDFAAQLEEIKAQTTEGVRRGFVPRGESTTRRSLDVKPGEQLTKKRTGLGTRTTIGKAEDPNIVKERPIAFESAPGRTTLLNPPTNVGQIPDFIPLPQTQAELEQLKKSGLLIPALVPSIIKSIDEIIKKKEGEELLAEQEAQKTGEEEEARPFFGQNVDPNIEASEGFFKRNLTKKSKEILGISGESTTLKTEAGRLAIGVAIAGAAVLGANALSGLFAGSLVPAAGTTVGSLTPAAAQSAVVGSAVAKTSILGTLASNKLVQAVIAGTLLFGKQQSTVNARISDLETSIVNMRETITLVGSSVTVGAITPTEGNLLLDDLEDTIDEQESSIHQTAMFSIKSRLGKAAEVETRVQKARQQLIVERARISNFANAPQVI